MFPVKLRNDLPRTCDQLFNGVMYCNNGVLENYPMQNGVLFSIISDVVGFQLAIGYQNTGFYYRDITNGNFYDWVKLG